MSSATQLAVLLGLMTFATVGDCGERQLFSNRWIESRHRASA